MFILLVPGYQLRCSNLTIIQYKAAGVVPFHLVTRMRRMSTRKWLPRLRIYSDAHIKIIEQQSTVLSLSLQWYTRGICGPTTILKAQFQGIVLCNHKITLEIRFNYHFHLSNTFHKVMLKSLARQNITRKVISCNNESIRKTNQQAWPAQELRFRTLFKIITSGCRLREFMN